MLVAPTTGLSAPSSVLARRSRVPGTLGGAAGQGLCSQHGRREPERWQLSLQPAHLLPDPTSCRQPRRDQDVARMHRLPIRRIDKERLRVGYGCPDEVPEFLPGLLNVQTDRKKATQFSPCG